MKRYHFLIIALMLLIFPAKNNAQESNYGIALCPIVEEWTEPFPATAQSFMVSRLNSLLTQNGVASSSYLGQFFITVRATPITKDVIPGPPMQIAQNMELTFYIADYMNQTVIASEQITVKGVGTTEAKTYMDCLRKINYRDPRLTAFINAGKVKIIDYYDSQAPVLLKKARNLAAVKEYEQAMFVASCIPSGCKYFDEAQTVGLEIYKMYIDYQCQVDLAEAKRLWAAEQNAAGAEKAGVYLAKILPDAACYGDAQSLYQEIKDKVLDDWYFEMKMYQDAVDLERDRIEAWRAVGVAYGNGQQPTTTNLSWLR